MSNDEIQPVEAISSASNDLNEGLVNIEAQLDISDLSHPNRPSIQPADAISSEEIPSIFGDWKSWDHFGFSKFLPETIKRKFVAYMERWCNLNVPSFNQEFQAKIDLLWSYYRGVDEQFRTENSDHLIDFLLVNSCFLTFALTLNHQVEILNENESEDSNWRTEFQNLRMFILRDKITTQQYMLTMDYQIPWFVVEAVYKKHSNLSSKHPDTPIHKHALLFLEDIYPGTNKSKVVHDTITGDLPPDGFKHLLHILHWSRTTGGKFLLNYRSWPPKMMSSFYIPSATDLKLSQTIFEKHPNGSIDVDFSKRRFYGVMQLAPFDLLPYSKKIYESLLRFEWEYTSCGLPFTSYVTCMVCLIQTEADVGLLRAYGIVPNTRNDEKDVLHYVQELKTLLDDTLYMQEDLDILSENVMAHYKKRVFRLYGEFKSRYCSNKWITLSVIAAILVFVFTFLQALYGILGYYNK